MLEQIGVLTQYIQLRGDDIQHNKGSKLNPVIKNQNQFTLFPQLQMMQPQVIVNTTTTSIPVEAPLDTIASAPQTSINSPNSRSSRSRKQQNVNVTTSRRRADIDVDITKSSLKPKLDLNSNSQQIQINNKQTIAPDLRVVNRFK